MLVIEEEEGDELRSMIKVPPYMKGRVSIVWHCRILEDSTQTFEEKNWISDRHLISALILKSSRTMGV